MRARALGEYGDALLYVLLLSGEALSKLTESSDSLFSPVQNLIGLHQQIDELSVHTSPCSKTVIEESKGLLALRHRQSESSLISEESAGAERAKSAQTGEMLERPVKTSH